MWKEHINILPNERLQTGCKERERKTAKKTVGRNLRIGAQCAFEASAI